MHGGVTDKGARQGRVKVPQFEGVADAQHNYVTPIQAGSLPELPLLYQFPARHAWTAWAAG